MNPEATNTPQDLTDEVPEADAVEQSIDIEAAGADEAAHPLVEPGPTTAEADAADVWEQSQVVIDEEEDRDREH